MNEKLSAHLEAVRRMAREQFEAPKANAAPQQDPEKRLPLEELVRLAHAEGLVRL